MHNSRFEGLLALLICWLEHLQTHCKKDFKFFWTVIQYSTGLHLEALCDVTSEKYQLLKPMRWHAETFRRHSQSSKGNWDLLFSLTVQSQLLVDDETAPYLQHSVIFTAAALSAWSDHSLHLNRTLAFSCHFFFPFFF